MQLSKLSVKPDAFAVLALIGLGVGCVIPAFYDWTGSDQSRAAPIVGQTALGLLIVVLAICIALPWIPCHDDPPVSCKRGSLRFSIRAILIATTVIAVFIALVSMSLLPLVGMFSNLAALTLAVRFWISFSCFRARLLSLLACMYLPFVWIVVSGTFAQSISALWTVGLLPMILPAAYIASLLRQNPDELAWLAAVVTSLELIGGLWIIRLGRRPAIAYHLIALLLSTFGSFGLNALLRM